MRSFDLDDGRITAALGPTNTGKTHRAVQRMLSHRSGMIGLPLRLLAQEVYERVAKAKGRASVALITGEQKVVPRDARYWVCTVEAMPVDRPVAFLAVDEIQLAGSRNRGHVFTERLLNARGVKETWFMGSETIEPLLRRLVPTAEILRLQRLSTLRHTGPRKLLRLPRRTAVVGFSAADVYAMAERLRAKHGGAAVVMGALSPRARNKQVALYQEGRVDHLVATDAIGMGLNMDVDHVALAALRKFDGWKHRDLTPGELAQIAGRAGRHHRDGTFGTLSDVGVLDEGVVQAIEQHRFRPLKRLFWRNADLDLRTFDGLRETLLQPPNRPGLVQVRDWVDHRTFLRLAEREDLQVHARSAAATERIWEVCQVPDFRKTLTDAHVQLLAQIIHALLGPSGRLDDDWVDGRVRRLERVDGDIDALMARISWVRTWNYISYRSDWLQDAAALQARCQALEDQLSDALHEQLTRRFVEKRSVVLIDGAGANADPVRRDEVQGRLLGLRYVPTPGRHGERLSGAARARVMETLAQRVRDLDPAGFGLEADGSVLHGGSLVARVRRGRTPTAPKVDLIRNDLLPPAALAQLTEHVHAWLTATLAPLLPEPHRRLRPAAKALVRAVGQGLGSAPFPSDVRSGLSEVDKRLLAKAGLRLGTEHLYTPASLTPAGLSLRARLWSLWTGEPTTAPHTLAASARTRSPDTWAALGFSVRGTLAVRVDALEQLAAVARKASRKGPFTVDADCAGVLKRPVHDVVGVLRDMGYVPAGRKRLARARRR